MLWSLINFNLTIHPGCSDIADIMVYLMRRMISVVRCTTVFQNGGLTSQYCCLVFEVSLLEVFWFIRLPGTRNNEKHGHWIGLACSYEKVKDFIRIGLCLNVCLIVSATGLSNVHRLKPYNIICFWYDCL